LGGFLGMQRGSPLFIDLKPKKKGSESFVGFRNKTFHRFNLGAGGILAVLTLNHG